MTSLGYLIGRFNPLQDGHKALLQEVHDNNDHMVVLVGSATESRTHKNPLTFEERKSVLLAEYPKALVLPLPDLPNDAEWVQLLEATLHTGIRSLHLPEPVLARLYSADATRADDYALRCSWVSRLGHEVVPFAPVTTRTDLSASLVRDAWYHGRYEEVQQMVPPATFEVLQRLDLGWMDSPYVKKVERGALGPSNAVFIAFIARPSHIYQLDKRCREWGHDAWYAKLGALGHIVRWNGELGFVGGMVDEDETLEQALQRECLEEIGHELDMSQVELFESHAMTRGGAIKHTHLYVQELSFFQLLSLRIDAVKANHAFTEMSAFCTTHLTPEAPDVLLSQRWAGSAKECLKSLLYAGKLPRAQVVVNDR